METDSFILTVVTHTLKMGWVQQSPSTPKTLDSNTKPSTAKRGGEKEKRKGKGVGVGEEREGGGGVTILVTITQLKEPCASSE